MKIDGIFTISKLIRDKIKNSDFILKILYMHKTTLILSGFDMIFNVSVLYNEDHNGGASLHVG